MNKEKILDLLKKLRDDYGVEAIKAEFEAEGSRKDELIMLREFVYKAEMGFIITIGGCEAVHDLDQCKLLDATGIMAPMIETPFAMAKYMGAAKKVYKNRLSDVEWIINAETKTCAENYDDILNISDGFLKAVTVGRSDLSASMGISRDDMESEKIFECTYKILNKSKEKNLITNFGGNIGIESISFIKRMSEVAQRFETRKVVLSTDIPENKIKTAIQTALKFEYEYLLYKKQYYNDMATEDVSRLERMLKQINA